MFISIVKTYLKALKKYCDDYYDSYGEKLYLDRLLGWLEARLNPIKNCSISLSIEGKLDSELEILVGTSSNGIVYIGKYGNKRLLSKNLVYGICKCPTLSSWYIFQKTGRNGRILRLSISKGRVQKSEIVVYGLSRGIHQIDIIKNKLMMTDTYNNRIIEIENYSSVYDCYWKNVSNSYWPNGKLNSGRDSHNYNHFNSIFGFEEDIYLIAHNETLKTGKKSEVYKLDSKLNLLTKETTNSTNSHNFYKNKEVEIFCASMENSLVVNMQEALNTDSFTRGLSVSDDYTIVGGSSIQASRSNRRSGIGEIYILATKAYKVSFTIKGSLGQINEIRRVDKTDFSLSANHE